MQIQNANTGRRDSILHPSYVTNQQIFGCVGMFDRIVSESVYVTPIRHPLVNIISIMD